MSDKSLQDKAIQIKGKDYVLVADRILYFNEIYKNGCIKTERSVDGDMEVIKAIVIPDITTPDRFFVGHSQATWNDGFINKTSALENAETSAVGRALAMMGIGVIESIASADEINKANSSAPRKEIRLGQFQGTTPVAKTTEETIKQESKLAELKRFNQLSDKVKAKEPIDKDKAIAYFKDTQFEERVIEMLKGYQID